MYKIRLTESALQNIKEYSSNYRKYYEELYQDTGLWWEDIIIQNYISEAENRYREIRVSLVSKLANSMIVYPDNQTIIRWRSKVILVSWEDDGDTRVITSLEIR